MGIQNSTLCHVPDMFTRGIDTLLDISTPTLAEGILRTEYIAAIVN
mgnify:CR=1 FL=1